MSQGSSSSFNTLSATNKFTPPIGQNLSNTATCTLAPSLGAIAYDVTTDRICLGNSQNVWIPGFGSTGSTGMTGGNGNVGPTGASSSLVVGGFNTGSTANGATIVGDVLTLYAASQTNPGSVATTSQTFGGVKSFADGINPSSYPLFLSDTPILNYFHAQRIGGVFFGGAAAPLIQLEFMAIGNLTAPSGPRPMIVVHFYSPQNIVATSTDVLISPANTIPSVFGTVSDTDAPFMTSNGGINVTGVCRIGGGRITLAPGYAPNDVTTLASYTIGSTIMIPGTSCFFMSTP